MARLTDMTFEHSGSTYKLTLDFDDAALMEDAISFDIIAERTGGRLPRLSVKAQVKILPREGLMIIYLGGQEVFSTGVFDHGPTRAEEFIQGMPSAWFGGDPIMGCAVKAGISSIIGQAIDCCRSLEDGDRWKAVGEYLTCMSKNFGKISRIAMFRAFKCIVTADSV